MSLPYKEGTWFAVPLRTSGFATGVVARSSPDGGVLLGYFFGPRRAKVPPVHELPGQTYDRAVLVARFGDVGLIEGSWPIIGHSVEWRRAAWPMPEFMRTDLLTGKIWRARYDDDDPSELVAERPLSVPDSSLERDRMCGAGSIEIQLDRLLR